MLKLALGSHGYDCAICGDPLDDRVQQIVLRVRAMAWGGFLEPGDRWPLRTSEWPVAWSAPSRWYASHKAPLTAWRANPAVRRVDARTR